MKNKKPKKDPWRFLKKNWKNETKFIRITHIIYDIIVVVICVHFSFGLSMELGLPILFCISFGILGGGVGYVVGDEIFAYAGLGRVRPGISRDHDKR